MLTTIATILVLLTAATASDGSPAVGIQPDIMPRDLSLLTYPDTPSVEDSNSVARIWTKADLDRASSVLNYEQMWPVIRRLEAGLPITVLAFGDSITKYGGCFHRDRCVKKVAWQAGNRIAYMHTDIPARYWHDASYVCNYSSLTPSTHF